MFRNEQEEFFNIHRDKLPQDFASSLEHYFGLSEIFFETIPAFEKIIQKPLTKLMLCQYPNLKTITNPQGKSYIHDINNFLSSLIWSMYFILRDQKNFTDLNKKYPKLEDWRSFYCKPSIPYQVSDSERNPFLHKSDEEWEQFKKEENEKCRILDEWEEGRKQAFYDVLQPILFQFFPDLLNLEGDHWVIYAAHIRDAYEQWKSFSERLESIIDYELPIESFYWENKDYFKAIHEKGPEYLRRSSEKRKKIIYGE